MLTDKNWVKHNVDMRRVNRTENFQGWIEPVTFQKLNFQHAADYTSNLIASRYPNLFLALSGGIDSEFMVCKFHELKIPFQVLICRTPYNALELEYAFHLCKTLNLQPIIIDCSPDLFWGVYEWKICNELNGDGPGSVSSLILSHYVSARVGTLIIGDHMLDVNHRDLLTGAGMAEWDFYTSVLYPGTSISFMYYTPELTYAMMKEISGIESHAEYKHRIYERPFRPKIQYQFDQIALDRMYAIRLKYQNVTIIRECSIGTNLEVIAQMDSWNDI